MATNAIPTIAKIQANAIIVVVSISICPSLFYVLVITIMVLISRFIGFLWILHPSGSNGNTFVDSI